jgi:hypothetical protein
MPAALTQIARTGLPQQLSFGCFPTRFRTSGQVGRFVSHSHQELTSTGVPTGIERQKRFGRFLSWLLETVRPRNAHELGVGARAEN